MSYADLAAAAEVSVADYLGEVPWQDASDAKDWYMRMKSRPAFRPLRADKVRGTAAGALRQPRLLTPAALRRLIVELAPRRRVRCGRRDHARRDSSGGATPRHCDRPTVITATMAWLADTAERRSSPTALWPEVRSIVMLGMNYGPESDPLATLADRRRRRSRSMRASGTITTSSRAR